MARLGLVAVVALSVLLWVAPALAGKMVLVKDGQPKAIILVSATAPDSVKAAVADFQRYIEKISGAKLQVITDELAKAKMLDPAPYVLIGKSPFTDLIVDVRIPTGVTKSMREEGYLIRCRSNAQQLILAGNDTPPYLGTRYAVSEFLRSLGVRWFMPGEFGEVVPKLPTIEVGELNISSRPDFPIRDYWTGGPASTRVDQREWKIHNLMNPDCSDWVGIPSDSSVRNFMPRDQVKVHPEWFALNQDGTRNENHPCMMDDLRRNDPKFAGQTRLVDVFADKIKAQARKGQHVSCFAPDDGFPRCYCDLCLKYASGFDGYDFNPRNPLPDGSISEEWFHFVNAVLNEVNKEFPDYTIATNGYANRDMPPEFKDYNKSKNMTVMFANIPACTIHAYDNPQCWQMQRQAEMLKRWCKVCDRVWLYDYNYTMLVGKGTITPTVTRLRRDIPLIKQWGSIGFFDQDDMDVSICGIPTTIVRARLEWDTKTNVDALLDDFYTKWFGAAAEPMKSYYDALESAFATSPQHGHEDSILPLIYSDALLATLDKSIAEAEKLATKPAEKSHVRVERLIHDYTRAYAAMEKAKQECKYADAIKQLDAMLALKAEMNKISPFLGSSNGSAYDVPWEKRRLTRLMGKTAGPEGELVAVMPIDAQFRIDPNDDGIYQRWQDPAAAPSGPGSSYRSYPTYGPAAPISAWTRIDSTRGWEELPGLRAPDGRPYLGWAWYRFTVNVPASAAGKSVSLCCPAVLNEAWVWANGEYIGHKDWRSQWSRPHELDMNLGTALKPGQPNQITIRVWCGSPLFGTEGIYERAFLYARK